MRRNQAGSTILELLATMTILSLLAGLAMPKYHELRNRAAAADAIGAMNVVRHAAFAYNETTGQWAPGGSTGITPPELVPYLPDGFRFSKPDFDLAWRHSTWLSGDTEMSSQMVQIFTHEPAVCDAVSRLLGGSGNPDLLAMCDGQTGIVILYLET